MTDHQNPEPAPDSELHPAKKDKTDYIIHKVIQALDILEQFQGEVDELSPAQLSRRIDLNEASVQLLLATLKSRNYLEQNGATGNFRLGFKNLELAQTVLRQTGLYRVSHPVLASVTLECGETCAVAVLRKSHVIELDAVPSEHPVQVRSRVGDHLPVHCTAAGKLLAAFLEGAALDALLGRLALEGYTPNTITCSEQLRLQLGQAAGQGYAVDDGELDRDVRGVAAAIRDYAGRVVGALVVTGPSCRIGREQLHGDLALLVQRGAREISAKLGFHEPVPQPCGAPATAAEALPRRGASCTGVPGKGKPAGTSRAA